MIVETAPQPSDFLEVATVRHIKIDLIQRKRTLIQYALPDPDSVAGMRPG